MIDGHDYFSKAVQAGSARLKLIDHRGQVAAQASRASAPVWLPNRLHMAGLPSLVF